MSATVTLKRGTALALIAPTFLIIGIFMVLPLTIAVVYSFLTANPYGGVQQPFTFDAYIQLLFQRDFDDTLFFSASYILIILRSVWIAAIATLICLVMGLPVAWYIVCQSPERRRALLFLVTLPFWINMLIRTYCWILILRDEGLINGLLKASGVIATPLPLLYNDGAILLGTVYTFLPFLVLPVYATLERIDPRTIEAAFDLYANRWAVARRIIWPMARPGVLAGASLVFAPAFGSFLAPDLLGGGKSLMIGSLIQMQFTSSRNWPFGAALATVVVALILAFFAWRARKREAAL